MPLSINLPILHKKGLALDSIAYQVVYQCFLGASSLTLLHVFCSLVSICKAFWDYIDKRQIGMTKAEWSVTSEWSPNGYYFMTATTAPRLQVDTG